MRASASSSLLAILHRVVHRAGKSRSTAETSPVQSEAQHCSCSGSFTIYNILQADSKAVVDYQGHQSTCWQAPTQRAADNITSWTCYQQRAHATVCMEHAILIPSDAMAMQWQDRVHGHVSGFHCMQMQQDVIRQARQSMKPPTHFSVNSSKISRMTATPSL